jgi:hypothetical protein
VLDDVTEFFIIGEFVFQEFPEPGAVIRFTEMRKFVKDQVLQYPVGKLDGLIPDGDMSMTAAGAPPSAHILDINSTNFHSELRLVLFE